ncbi:flagellar hook-associated protein FlgK [Donghicola sp.]|jgi:flagellar hook-associated protein 1 FlgK|uniref:flagellar hook-associated protein FlgK n=1 Tax=Donghicola sp. TaxID=1929294 RepID=UPI0025F00C19|nr:flagellar hook-associated protein FlgK [Donghicola sp.]MCT4578574.1 flagellar hook-associated protein FlgK [Donghicola sp.]
MSLTSAISNALSGLGATSLGAEIVSSNLSNASNAAYAKREVSLVSNLNGGVQVTGIQRHRDAAVQASLNAQSAQVAAAEVRTHALAAVDAAVGTVGDSGSLTTALDDMQYTLISAAAQPESDVRLNQVLYAAEDLAARFNAIGDAIQAERLSADHAVARDVETVNEVLSQIEKLNKQIISTKENGRGAATLSDQRDQAIATLSELIPVRTLERDNGSVALVSRGGQVLLDGKAVTLEFTPVQGMDEAMTLDSGALSGISIVGGDGDDISNRLIGGQIAATLQVRDKLMPQASDELAAERQSMLDATAFDGAGLFTEVDGVLSVNEQLSADPWRLRDGFTPTSPGYVANAGFLDTLAAGTESISDSLGNYVSKQSAQLLRAEMSETSANARHTALQEAAASEGVDSDAELQSLLMIEKLYTANARVISVVDEMMDTLMRMT